MEDTTGKVIIERNKALKALAGKIDGLYLAGGTALSVFYFHHRESYDLDIFTKKFSRLKIEAIVSDLAKATGRKIELIKTQEKKEFVQMMIYYLYVNKDETLKIDFVEDVYDLLKPVKIIDGTPVLSIEDIYIRKILAACGSDKAVDVIGREIFKGGRQEARDFFDLYFLSTTFMPLSKFALEHCSYPQRESLSVWYRTYSRSSMQMGVLDIVTDKNISFKDMDNHFKREIEQMVRKEFE
ncbi:MAG: nucleotidyl transferase AbiEii/AbiGii toxin family protein [Candidatus Omnitrophota bacterium]|nr:nucleotidyl transferase AbiEii/AbiGii toxin family protein [Candidatus Omnitrophota bacterium]